jgi:hypothetical protein
MRQRLATMMPQDHLTMRLSSGRGIAVREGAKFTAADLFGPT